MADPSSAMAACEQRIREEPVRRVGTWRERLRRSGPAGGDQGRGNIIGRRAGPSQRQHVTAGVDATSELRIGGEHGSLPDTSDAAGRRTFQRRVTLGDRSVCAVRAEDQPARGSASDQLGCPPLRGGRHRTRASAAPATRSPIHAMRLFISAMIHRYAAGCVGATGRVCEGHMKGGCAVVAGLHQCRVRRAAPLCHGARHVPVQVGARFSRKAAKPSWASSVPALAAMIGPAWSYAPGSPGSRLA